MTINNFPENDKFWKETADFVSDTFQTLDPVLDLIIAPEEFDSKISGQIISYSAASLNSLSRCECLIIHKGRMNEIDASTLEEISINYIPVFANQVFVVLTSKTDLIPAESLPKLDRNDVHVNSFYENAARIKKQKGIQTLINSIKTFFHKSINKTSKFLDLKTSRTNQYQQPNLSPLNSKLLFSSDIVRSNIKALGYQYARDLLKEIPKPENLTSVIAGLDSKACTQRDIESKWFAYWCQELNVPIVYNRKLWEFCYILQIIHEHDLLRPNLKGLGFGCGEEPLPSLLAAYDIAITATDIDPNEAAAKGWIETNQNANSLEKIWHSELCPKALFDKNVTLEYVDMNMIPKSLNNKYDFCWSACALEHLGSIKNGLDFIENSLNTLVPGGICIHTTEYNFLEEDETIDNWVTVLFRKCDFRRLANRLTAQGHEVLALNFDIGDGFMDQFVDIPPYQGAMEAHLKLLIDGFATTSFGIVVKKKS